jgi:GT2 family glycosyltransferase
MISFVLPTRNRPDRLAATLDAIGGLTIGHRAEVVIVDNASDRPVRTPRALANGTTVRLVRLDHNAGAAARNAGVEAADPASDWVVMLDDDSHPVESVEPFAATVDRLLTRPPETAAVMADIHLPALGRRESGGLPQVFVGCGVAIRRNTFTALGGYDPSFGYYVEEYDLSARILARGWSIGFDPAFCVHHHKVESGRDMDVILERLVRNNGWVMQRFAPGSLRRAMHREQRRRYRLIAEKEHALTGYARGLVQLRHTCRDQRRTPLLRNAWDHFTGLAHARAAINLAWRERPFGSVALVEPGKNAWAVEQALAETCFEAGIPRTRPTKAEAVVIGTLSPGPMLDAAARWSGLGHRVVTPWLVAQPMIPRAARAA